ncbi:MAG: putative porin [Alteromonadaceae bacterium]|nr:putative porin [Alteromonadaceae bacterium]
MHKLTLSLIALSLASSAVASEIHTIGNIAHSEQDDYQTTSIGITHYFDGRETLGPIDKLSFINHSSSISGSYFNSDVSDGYGFAGTFIADNGLLLGGALTKINYDDMGLALGDFETRTLSAGYQGFEGFSIVTYYRDPDEGDSEITVAGQYEHKLKGNDYIGLGVSIDEDADFINFTSEYFTDLGNGHFLQVNGQYVVNDLGDDYWSAGGTYYLSEKSSVYATVGDDSFYSIGAKHFFTSNFALGISYADSDNADEGLYSALASVQF